jgi:hypothetical protein
MPAGTGLFSFCFLAEADVLLIDLLPTPLSGSEWPTDQWKEMYLPLMKNGQA